MFLDTTTRSLQVLLAAARATNDCPVVVDYVDFTSTTTTPGNQLSKTNGTTLQTILSAPSSSTKRKVNYISLCNYDTDFVIVTIQLNDNGTTYNYVNSLQLPPNSTLQFTDTLGWVVIDSGGNMVVATQAVADIQIFNTSGIWTRPPNVTYTQVDAVGGGGAGGGGDGGAAGTVRPGAGGGGGGKHAQMLFLSSDLTDRVGVTVAAQVPGALGGSSAVGTAGGAGNISRFGNFLLAYGGGGGGVNATNGGGGGGGGGGTGVGGSSSSASGASGGPAIQTGVAAATSVATDRGGGGGAGSTTPSSGGSSYLGGGGGGAGSDSTNPGSTGGSSFFSAAAGGGGGSGGEAATPGTAQNGGTGGNVGGAATAAGGGGAGGIANASAGTNGADGQIPSFCGQGGGGGGGNNAGTGFNGGNGGIPGGGGGGGGGGTTVGGNGGAGARGQVIVVSW